MDLYVIHFVIPVRITSGSSPNEGLVEVYFNGRWGTVCHNNWNDKLASLVCVQLGLSSSGKAADFAPGTGNLFLSNIICSENETTLASCGHYGVGIPVNCDHSKDVGVKCHGIFANVSVRGIINDVSFQLPKG